MSTAGGQAPAMVSPGAQIRRKILRGSAWVFAGRMGSIVIGLAINALLARLLSRDGLGGYFVASSMVMIGSTVACLGMNKTVVRLVAGSLAVNRAGRARDAIRITFAVGIASALLLATVLALGPGRALATHLFGSSVVADAMPFVAGWLAAMTMQTLVAETYRGLKRFRAATLFSGLIVDVFSLAVFGTLWLQNAHPSLSEVLFIMLVVTALPAVYGVIRILLKLPRMRRGGGFTDTREVLGISLPLLIVSLSAFFVGTGVDIWVVGYFEPIDQVALYGAAAKLMFIVSTPLIIVSQVVPTDHRPAPRAAPPSGARARTPRDRDLDRLARGRRADRADGRRRLGARAGVRQRVLPAGEHRARDPRLRPPLCGAHRLVRRRPDDDRSSAADDEHHAALSRGQLRPRGVARPAVRHHRRRVRHLRSADPPEHHAASDDQTGDRHLDPRRALVSSGARADRPLIRSQRPRLGPT